MSETREEKIIIGEGYAKVWELMILQAIKFSRGQDIADILHGLVGSNYYKQKREEVRLAREYIQSTDFEEDCDYIGWDYEVIREKLYRQWKEAKTITRGRVQVIATPGRLDYWREKVAA